MSAPTVPPPPVPSADAGSPKRGRRTGTMVAVLAVVLVGVLAALALAVVVVGGSRDSSGPENKVPGDPANYRGTGTAALAETLKSHGVRVRVTRDQAGLKAWDDASSSTVVVISRATGASKSSTRVLMDKSRRAQRIVLLDPRPEVLAQWGLGIEEGQVYVSASDTSPTAGCSIAGIAPTDTGGAPGVLFTVAAPDTATVCFASAANPRAGSVLVFPASGWRPEIVVAQGEWFRNDSILEHDRAGIAVRMIGAGNDVAWFAPEYGDLQHDQQQKPQQPTKKLEPDIPRWLWPMIWLGFFALIALALWRGRRFGQLIAEPLPAVVKAAETTEARGRLYQASADTQRAAAQLRAHALRTMPKRLGVSRHAPIDDIVAAIARATGHDHAAVLALLAGPLPTDDAGFVRFATDLSTLEEEVRPVL